MKYTRFKTNTFLCNIDQPSVIMQRQTWQVQACRCRDCNRGYPGDFIHCEIVKSEMMGAWQERC